MDAPKPRTGIEHLAQYRQLLTLPDGLRVCLRPLVHKTRMRWWRCSSPSALTTSSIFGVASPMALWWQAGLEEVDYSKVFRWSRGGGSPGGQLYAPSGEWVHETHREIRVFLAKEFRRRGIGSAMIKAQIEVARKIGLHQLAADIVESRPQVVHAFEHLGFERQAVLRDQFMTRTGTPWT